jgi:hypothetical protein
MTKLTDTQLIVLSSAAKHDEGLATKPINLHAAAAQKVASSLINKGLVREIRAKTDAPVWHENDDGRFALKALISSSSVAPLTKMLRPSR